MREKKAYLVINPRAGQNIVKLPDIMTVLAAAGWDTDIAIKEYGGHTMELANEAAEKNYDLVIGYGGDGTLCQVVNGVMNAGGQHSTVGLIPGGTANVWASEIGLPTDPIKAVLALVDSEPRKVDIGHVEVESLTFPEANQGGQNRPGGKKSQKKKAQSSPKAKHHFLLMAGLGLDAAVMGHVSKPLKYRIGPLAVGLSAAKEVPTHHQFPLEIRVADGSRKGEVLWKGEALQVVIGNTRRYADIVEMTPNAYIDDGVLDVCVITAGDPLTTLQQVTSLLLRRKPDNLSSEYFHGAHLIISVPATVDLQLDGSVGKLKDYLSKPDREALEQAEHKEQVMVNYRFDALPSALRVAIPCTYDDALFEDSVGKKQEQHDSAQEEQRQSAEDASQDRDKLDPHTDEERQGPQQSLEHLEALSQNGRKVIVAGVARVPDKKLKYIVAGVTTKRSTGDAKPVALRIDDNTTIVRRTGESAPSAVMQKLPEGGEVLVEGKLSKRGVMQAKRVVF
jgi:YegS/Rv2252/BmrU family lipid kinase